MIYMKNLMKIPKKQMPFYLLSLAMILFVVFPVEIPQELAGLINTMLGKIVIVVVVLNLFVAHPVVGAIGAVAAYELLKRSGMHGNFVPLAEFVPSEKKKQGNLNAFNQFPVTVEEMVIKEKIPYTFNMGLGNLTVAPYKPIQTDLHDASIV